MMRKSQVINYLSVRLWETLGNDAPSQDQIDIFEDALEKSLPDADVNSYNEYLDNLTQKEINNEKN